MADQGRPNGEDGRYRPTINMAKAPNFTIPLTFFGVGWGALGFSVVGIERTARALAYGGRIFRVVRRGLGARDNLGVFDVDDVGGFFSSLTYPRSALARRWCKPSPIAGVYTV